MRLHYYKFHIHGYINERVNSSRMDFDIKHNLLRSKRSTCLKKCIANVVLQKKKKYIYYAKPLWAILSTHIIFIYIDDIIMASHSESFTPSSAERERERQRDRETERR